ncbi:uncharacterized protein LOC143806617 [Ranitomeya variabilis]|uniref:uncharacterized protein LOC143806617 n=1 Tax=Ranitomeya variabilis TaxID=490064 RepID=UPI004055FF71
MSSNKFRRAYSLRIPKSPKPATFLDPSGFYDRLDDTEFQDDHQGQNEVLGNKDNNSFSWEIPLITDAPKLHYCRKKWSSKSLRLPKSRPAEVEPPTCPTEEATQVEEDTCDSIQEPERPSSSEGRRLSDDDESHKETENEGQRQKSKKMKQYKKTIDRAFRRGWVSFISNIYTMSLTRTSQDAPHLIKAC